MKKFVILLVTFFVGNVMLFAQEMNHPGMEGHAHNASFTKPDAFVANTIIWVSVGVVVVTLILTLKYLFKPKEDSPNHIKNIVLDDGF